MSDFTIPILTILCGGVISGMVTHRLETSRAERELRRQKLEQLYTAVHRFSSMLVSITMIHSQVMAGKIDYNQALDMIIDLTKEKTRDYENAVMLANIYFPDLLHPLEDVIAQRDACNALQFAFRKKYDQQGPAEYPDEWQTYRAASLKLDELAKAFNSCLFRLASKL